jgi:hypothetical protein
MGITAVFLPPSDESRQRSKWSAVARLESAEAAGELVIWTSGEAEITVVYLSDGAIRIGLYQLTEADPTGCLDDLTDLMLHRPPDDQLHLSAN